MKKNVSKVGQPRKLKRNQEIHILIKFLGKRVVDVANDYGISKGRVVQIAKDPKNAVKVGVK